MPSARSLRLFSSLAVSGFIVLVVVLVYADALHMGRWPMGHPWSGLTFLVLAFAYSFIARENASPWLKRGVGAAICIAGVLWWIALR